MGMLFTENAANSSLRATRLTGAMERRHAAPLPFEFAAFPS